MDDEQITMLYMHFVFNDAEASNVFEDEINSGRDANSAIEFAIVISYDIIRKRNPLN